MRECPSCGKDVGEDVRFCGYCGYELTHLKKKTVLGMPTIAIDASSKRARREAPATVVMASVSPEEAHHASEIEISPQNSGRGEDHALNVRRDGDEVALKGQNALHVAQFDSPTTQPIKTHTYEVSVDASGKARPSNTTSDKNGQRENANRSTLFLSQAIHQAAVTQDADADGWPSPSASPGEGDNFDFSGLDDGWGMPPTVDGPLPVTTETPRDEALEELIRATAQHDDATATTLPPTTELPSLTSDPLTPTATPATEPGDTPETEPAHATALGDDHTPPPDADAQPAAASGLDEHEAALADTLEASRATMLESINSMSSHQGDPQETPPPHEQDLAAVEPAEASTPDDDAAPPLQSPEDIGRSETLPTTQALPDAGAMGVPSAPALDAKAPSAKQGKETALIANHSPAASSKGTALIANTRPDADVHEARDARPPAGSMDDPLDDAAAEDGLGIIKWLLAAAIALVFFGCAALFVVYFLMT